MVAPLWSIAYFDPRSYEMLVQLTTPSTANDIVASGQELFLRALSFRESKGLSGGIEKLLIAAV